MATTQRVQYGIDISANTSQAKQAIADLQRSIQSLQNTAEGDNFLNEKMNKAAAAAKELQLQLAKATNVNTGKLNLSLLNDNLKASGKSAQQLMTSLLEGGRTGQQAFASMANAIAQAEVPLKQTNKLIADFGNTLKNTVKWEISSNLVHGLESAMSGAVSYAKNLNSSLTDIRIVTGQSTEQMAKFAQYANKAAKDLSTSTRSYADAALIYYQQGDSDAMAKKKAELTIKASNASFDSDAKEMSEYLTAVWNSYQVGSDQLEHYIDVMASLGAKTATSLEEIATSMQKVAATANTVGVSMEQMSSIISTVSSVTREAPESIGTSYKTILARMGDLKLGGSDEDGVTLGTVSSQLDKIGVKVLDANNDLRDMGDIIWDLGEKWQTMNTATKSAVAQAVAGKRQYTQLMALFDNWDMYKENLQISANSDGALEKMAGTWTESWEAASKRVQASLESIYDKLLDDQGFIKILNITSALLDKVDSLIDGFGGLAGILTKLGSVATVVFGQQMASGIDKNIKNIKLYFSQFSGVKDFAGKFVRGEVKNAQQIQTQNDFKEFSGALTDSQNKATDPLMKQSISSAQTLLNLKQQLLENESNLSTLQKQRAQEQIALLGQEQAKLQEILEEQNQYQKDTSASEARIKRELGNNNLRDKNYHPQFSDRFSQNKEENLEIAKLVYDSLGYHYNEKQTSFNHNGNISLVSGLSRSNYLARIYEQVADLNSEEEIISYLSQDNKVGNAVTKKIAKILKEQGLKAVKDFLNKLSEAEDTAARDIVDDINGMTGGRVSERLENLYDQNAGEADRAISGFQKSGQIKQQTKDIDTLLSSVKEKTASVGQGLVSAGQAAMGLADGFRTSSALVTALNADTKDFTTILGSAANIAMSIGSSIVSGNWLMAIAQGVGAIFGVMSQLREEELKHQTELHQKELDKNQESLEKNVEEQNTNDSLIKSYSELYNTYLQTGEGQDALKESAIQLADAYGNVEARVAAAAGEFERFQALIKASIGANFSSLEQRYSDNIKSAENSVVEANMSGGATLNRFRDTTLIDDYALDDDYTRGQKILKEGIPSSQQLPWEDRFNYIFSQIVQDSEGDLIKLTETQLRNTIINTIGNISDEDFSEILGYFKKEKKGLGGQKYSFNTEKWSANDLSQVLSNQLLKNTFGYIPGSLEGEYTDNKGNKFELNGQLTVSDLIDQYGNLVIDENDVAGSTDKIAQRAKEIGAELDNLKKLFDKDGNFIDSVPEDEELRTGIKAYYDYLTNANDFLTEGQAAYAAEIEQLNTASKGAEEINILKNNFYNIFGKNESNTSFDAYQTYINGLIDSYAAISDSQSDLQQYLVSISEANEEQKAKLDSGEYRSQGGYLLDKQGNFIIKDGQLSNYKLALTNKAISFSTSYGGFDTYANRYYQIENLLASDPSLTSDLEEGGEEKLRNALYSLFDVLKEKGIENPSNQILMAAARIAKENGFQIDINDLDQNMLKAYAAYESAFTGKKNYDKLASFSPKSSYSSLDEAVTAISSLRELGINEDISGKTLSEQKQIIAQAKEDYLKQTFADAEIAAEENRKLQKKSEDKIRELTNTDEIAFDQDGNIIDGQRYFSLDQIKNEASLFTNVDGQLKYNGKDWNGLETESLTPIAKQLFGNMPAEDIKSLLKEIKNADTFEGMSQDAQDLVKAINMVKSDPIEELTKKYQTLISAMSSLPTTTQGWEDLSEAIGMSVDDIKALSDSDRAKEILKILSQGPDLTNITNENERAAAIAAWESEWKSAVDNVASYGTAVYDSLKAYSDDLQEKIDEQQSQIDDMLNAVSGKKQLGEADAWGLNDIQKEKFNKADRFTQMDMIAQAQKDQKLDRQTKLDIDNSYLGYILNSEGFKRSAFANNYYSATGMAENGANSLEFSSILQAIGFEPAQIAFLKDAVNNNKISLYNTDHSKKTNEQIIDEFFTYVDEQIKKNNKAVDKENAESDQTFREAMMEAGFEAMSRSEFQKAIEAGQFGDNPQVAQEKLANMQVNGYSIDSKEEAQSLQTAINNALKFKKTNDWNQVGEEDRNILESFNINGFNQLDDASAQCAKALDAFASSLLLIANLAMTKAGYEQKGADAQGRPLWYQAGTDIQVDESTQDQYNELYDASKVSNENTAKDDKTLRDAKEAGFKDLSEQKEYLETAIQIGKILTANELVNKDFANDNAEALELQRKMANELKRCETGLTSLNTNGKTWLKTLNSTKSSIEEQSDALQGLKKGYKDVLNLTDDQADKLGKDFLMDPKALKLAQTAAKDAGKAGQDALDQLQAMAATSITPFDDATVKVEDFGVTVEEMAKKLASLQGIDVGQLISGTDEVGQQLGAFWDTIYQQCLDAGMNIADAVNTTNSVLNSVGYDVEPAFETVDVPVDPEGFKSYVEESGVTSITTLVNGMPQTLDIPTFQEKYVNTGAEKVTVKAIVGKGKTSNFNFRKRAESHGGSGGKKSSGGGGGKKKQNKDYKLASDEIDRYHYVEQRLKRTNAQLTENDKLKEKAYGSKYLSYLDSEISKLKDLESEYKMYKDKAAGYLASDRARMAELGAQFDVEGNIKNYEEMRKAWLDAYNAGVDAWNNSDQEEGAELAFKQVEKQYEEKTKALQKYEESLEKYEEAQNNILEQQNKVAEALLEQIQTKLEYTTELNETDLKLLEHYSKRYEDQLADQGKSMMNILNQAKQYEENLQAVTEAQAALNAQHAARQLTDAKYQEGLADLIDKSLEYADALEDLKNDIKEVYQNALDLADEELEKHTAKIDAAKEAVQSYIDILGLLGRGENFANLQKYYYGIYENSLQNLKVQKAYLDTLNQQAEYFKGKGTQMTELEKEQYEALQEKIRDVNSEVLSSTQDTLSALQDAYNNAISDIFKKLDDAMGGAEDSVQALADKYGYYQEEQQRYVSTAKELYEVSKLNRSIEQSIEDSTTAASKERLKALQKLIAAQSKANKLTQYDLDMMNLQYQLALAMEELENAKNAKDTVRLTRDDNGNYGYQYTADQDKINNAQQKYEDVLQQINELAANRISELEQSFLNAQQQYLQSAREIASDMTLTEEQRAEKLTNLQKQYAETMKYIQEQYNTAFKELSVNQEAVSKHYGTTLVETTSSTALQVNDQMKSMIDNVDTYIQNLDAAIGTKGAASTAWKNYVGDIAEVAKALTGIDTGNVQANIDALTKALAESMSKYTEESKDTVDEAQKTFNTIANSLKSVNDATEAWNKHAETIERTETAYEKLATTMQKNIKILANGKDYSGTASYGGDDTPNSDSDNPLSTGTVKAPTISGAAATGGLSSVIEANFTNKVSTSIGEATARALSDSLRTQIEAYIAALNTNFDTIGGALKSSSWTIEQNVHIDASFPNVQDHNEIEEAINDLINSATQYANRKGE